MATSTRAASEIPRTLQVCCDYGEELPVPTAVTQQETPKYWGQPRFKGKSVLVTGGDSGIGLAAVEAFYMECASVMLVGHSPKKSEAAYYTIHNLTLPQQCAGSSPRIAWAAADVSNNTEVEAVLRRVVEEFGSLDIAVNNAGVAPNESAIGGPGFVDAHGALATQAILDVNLKGTLFCMNAEIGYWLKEGKPGNIVNVASIAGETAWLPPVYTTSKWGMIGFTKQAALQWAGKGIRINAVAPGAVNTTMLFNGLSPDDPAFIARYKIIQQLIPDHRIAEPWDMAGPITFLASDMANYVTGTVVTADGGFSISGPVSGKNSGFALGAETSVGAVAGGEGVPTFVV